METLSVKFDHRQLLKYIYCSLISLSSVHNPSYNAASLQLNYSLFYSILSFRVDLSVEIKIGNLSPILADTLKWDVALTYVLKLVTFDWRFDDDWTSGIGRESVPNS